MILLTPFVSAAIFSEPLGVLHHPATLRKRHDSVCHHYRNRRSSQYWIWKTFSPDPRNDYLIRRPRNLSGTQSQISKGSCKVSIPIGPH